VSDISKAIISLVEASGKSSSKMTHGLKSVGNGSMQAGITRIADYFAKEGIKVGAIGGFIGGSVAVGVPLILFLRKVINENKKHKAEGEAILRDLEAGMLEAGEADCGTSESGTSLSIVAEEDAQVSTSAD
jgi:hypothetical protein